MALILHHISHHYRSGGKYIEVLRHLNLSADPGEFVSIVGPSGCGKTTVAHIIAGFITPTAGRVMISQREVQGPGKDRILISQENDLFDWMTVDANMRLASTDEETIGHWLQLVGLASSRRKYPSQLSGGMKKRASLARALAAQPACLIMDEPFASTDHHLKLKLHEELMHVYQSLRNTVVLVTHDLEEAIFLSRRVVVLSGTPATIRSELFIPFPYPRRHEVRESKDFFTLKHRLLAQW